MRLPHCPAQMGSFLEGCWISLMCESHHCFEGGTASQVCWLRKTQVLPLQAFSFVACQKDKCALIWFLWRRREEALVDSLHKCYLGNILYCKDKRWGQSLICGTWGRGGLLCSQMPKFLECTHSFGYMVPFLPTSNCFPNLTVWKHWQSVSGHRRNIQDLSAISSPHHSRNRQKLLNRDTIYRGISKHIFCDRICLRLNAFMQFRFRFG